jgi:hypothetical protein
MRRVLRPFRDKLLKVAAACTAVDQNSIYFAVYVREGIVVQGVHIHRVFFIREMVVAPVFTLLLLDLLAQELQTIDFVL